MQSWCGLPAIIERLSWRDVANHNHSATAIVLDMQAPFEESLALLRKLADRAWQSLSLCCLQGEIGVHGFYFKLWSLGYPVSLAGGQEETRWADLHLKLQGILEGRAWLAPRFAAALGCSDPLVVHAFDVALNGIPDCVTVKRWGEAIGPRGRKDLVGILDSHVLPNPKILLNALRLTLVVRIAEELGQNMRVTRDQLARGFGYSSGDYLGKQARTLAGLRFQELVRKGVERSIELLAGRLKILPHERKK